jgi:hypothetical protein
MTLRAEILAETVDYVAVNSTIAILRAPEVANGRVVGGF